MASALAMLARAEGKGALQPLNATSHWLHGEQAGFVTRADAAHILLWDSRPTTPRRGFGRSCSRDWIRGRRSPAPIGLLRDSAIIAAIAAAVDYGITPKRLTPGWEAVLSKRAIATTYIAMAFGLTAGALVTQALRTHASRGQPIRPRRSAAAIAAGTVA
jgi:hypothetical protein